MSDLFALLREGVLVQTFVTLSLTGAVIFMALTGRPMAGLLENGFMMCLGFYFAAQVQAKIDAALRARALEK